VVTSLPQFCGTNDYVVLVSLALSRNSACDANSLHWSARVSYSAKISEMLRHRFALFSASAVLVSPIKKTHPKPL
jgi:hypothetical protein